ncbi:PIN domain-containing protein [Modestobacter sp. I12A-02628]|uniref:Ribonuclease VapC n=1 Tax=Goekera deserti TaxID=2497753 RepID=A0A7K3WIW4_9ACTN|nr:type II toxin-antitoxin system VapC family toxin [Goekera deserti]MPQ99294.1 PIN domain-containing protein [Goekera deserti]NDI50293.1 PIN domain-containing protein [Goekera deserti]NEL56455.1 type II toxin-antitoxin system VapC family toxin [Goekera deserti]
MIAFDTSALVKLIVDEAESDALARWLAARPDIGWTASELCVVEVTRAVVRADPSTRESARALLDGIDLVPMSRSLLDRAAALRPPELRSLDAVHLAAALGLGPDVEVFVSYDHRQVDAAHAAGLATVSPT